MRARTSGTAAIRHMYGVEDDDAAVEGSRHRDSDALSLIGDRAHYLNGTGWSWRRLPTQASWNGRGMRVSASRGSSELGRQGVGEGTYSVGHVNMPHSAVRRIFRNAKVTSVEEHTAGLHAGLNAAGQCEAQVKGESGQTYVVLLNLEVEDVGDIMPHCVAVAEAVQVVERAKVVVGQGPETQSCCG